MLHSSCSSKCREFCAALANGRLNVAKMSFCSLGDYVIVLGINYQLCRAWTNNKYVKCKMGVALIMSNFHLFDNHCSCWVKSGSHHGQVASFNICFLFLTDMYSCCCFFCFFYSYLKVRIFFFFLNCVSDKMRTL